MKSSAVMGALVMVAAGVTSAAAADGPPMSVNQQNALVRTRCAVCHSDAARSGGLSLERFDAAQAAPSLAAMLVSKLTAGVSLDTVRAAASDPDAADMVVKRVAGGAINAAGAPVPDGATAGALSVALALRTTGADGWHVDRATGGKTTASILRELISQKGDGVDVASMYRLVVTCDAASREGEMQLTWAPIPRRGTLSVAVDGKAPSTYAVEGAERMGATSEGVAAPAAVTFHHSNADSQRPLLPADTLTVSNLFPNQTVEFPFRDLPEPAREALAACFSTR